jgi:uncharacterized protein (TIGR02391 family)
MPQRSFEYDEDQVLAMSVEDVALAILRDAHDNREWNAYNWMGLAAQGYGGPALRRLAEGWQWLFSKGAVARDYRQSATDSMFVTELGRSLLAEGTDRLIAEERLGLELHPSLEGKVRRQFLLGEFDLAVFAAFRQVEVRVRELITAPDSRIGIPLMRDAFGEGGKLRAAGVDEGELDARAHLFAGAMGVFKNPTSHREVDFSDPTEAAEAVLFADLLMRLVDRIAEDASKTDSTLEQILEELRERGIGR